MAFLFSRESDYKLRQIITGLGLVIILFIAGFYYYAYPQYTRVGFNPDQPVPFSHQIHAGQLGMDCRYCHNNVEDSPHATVPATQVCMNCHNPAKANIKGNSPLLTEVRDSWKTGYPIEWKRIHQLPGYAYFNHSVHIARGVSCVSCHGKINEMPVVFHAKPLTMGWCLSCHNHPEEAVRPLQEVTHLNWEPEPGKTQEEIGQEIVRRTGIHPPNHCGACHR